MCLTFSCSYWHYSTGSFSKYGNPINKREFVLCVTRQQLKRRSANEMWSSCSYGPYSWKLTRSLCEAAYYVNKIGPYTNPNHKTSILASAYCDMEKSTSVNKKHDSEGLKIYLFKSFSRPQSIRDKAHSVSCCDQKCPVLSESERVLRVWDGQQPWTCTHDVHRSFNLLLHSE